jgi:hypothetical protein
MDSTENIFATTWHRVLLALGLEYGATDTQVGAAIYAARQAHEQASVPTSDEPIMHIQV